VRLVAVFDTKILMSAVVWKGTPLKCLELARSSAVDGLTCREILDELAGKLEVKLSLPPEDIAATVQCRGGQAGLRPTGRGQRTTVLAKKSRLQSKRKKPAE
jgi:hypothetical protein